MTGVGDPSESADVAALEDLWHEHALELVRYATLLVGPSEAADVASIAFTKFADADRAAVVNVRAFLMRVVTNTAIDQLRSEKRRQRRDLAAVLPASATPSDSHIDIRRAVARLNVHERAVVYFTYWEDLDAHTIAEMLGVNVGTVRRQLARARFQLRKVLE